MPFQHQPISARSWLFAPDDSEKKMGKAADSAAELKGRSLAERTKRLIAIAHPDYRKELDKAAFEIRNRGF